MSRRVPPILAIVAALAALAGPLPALANPGLEGIRNLSVGDATRASAIGVAAYFANPAAMSLGRRLELLEWAARHGAWILEDDYDSEYRYSGRPLAALQGIDRNGRVVYLGTFSKVLFPALRLGYMVVPPALAEAFRRAKDYTDRGNSILEQATLAAFLEEGRLERHLRRMRLLYRERQEALVYWSEKLLGEALRVNPSDAGLHAVGWLEKHQDDRRVSETLRQREVIASPVSGYTQQFRQAPGLVLGYAPYGEGVIRGALEKIGKVLEMGE